MGLSFKQGTGTQKRTQPPPAQSRRGLRQSKGCGSTASHQAADQRHYSEITSSALQTTPLAGESNAEHLRFDRERICHRHTGMPVLGGGASRPKLNRAPTPAQNRRRSHTPMEHQSCAQYQEQHRLDWRRTMPDGEHLGAEPLSESDLKCSADQESDLVHSVRLSSAARSTSFPIKASRGARQGEF